MQAGDPKLALASFQKVVDRFADTAEHDVQVMVAHALIAQSVVHGEADEPELALGALQEVVDRYEDSMEPSFQDTVNEVRSWIDEYNQSD